MIHLGLNTAKNATQIALLRLFTGFPWIWMNCVLIWTPGGSA